MSSSSSSACSTRPRVADVAPVDSVGVVAEVAVDQLLQPRQLGVDLRSARDVGSARAVVAHRGLRLDRDAVIHALFRPEAKRPAMQTFALYNDFNACVL